MEKRFHFTKPEVGALPAAGDGKRVYYDDDVIKGLQVAVTDRGAKTYYLYRKVQGKPQRVRLGAHPDIAPERARRLAEKQIGQIAEGRNPNSEKRAARARKVTLAEAFAEFLAARKNLKPKTIYDYQKVIDVLLEDWKARPVVEISKDMVAARHSRIGKERGAAYANLSMRLLRAALNFASARWERPDGTPLLIENPVRRLSQTRAWYRDKRRQPVITADQLPAWYAAVQGLKEDGPGTTADTVADFLVARS